LTLLTLVALATGKDYVQFAEHLVSVGAEAGTLFKILKNTI